MSDIITARIDFYPCNGGMFEDCAAEFRIETEPADPSVGIFRPTAEARFLSAQIGGFEVDRKTLIAMLTSPDRDGLAEVEEIEDRVAADYEAEFHDPDWAAERLSVTPPNDFSEAGLPVSPGQLPSVASCNTSQAWPPSCHRGLLSKGNEMAYEIEDGIERPDATGRGRQYPFPDLEVGQSFFAPGKTTPQVSGPMQRWKRVLGRRFSIRKVDGGVRVWRIE